MQQHWNAFYADTQIDRTGFWEPTPEASLRLVERCNLLPEDLILDAGGGASTFALRLIERGFKNLVVADISQVALDNARERLGVSASSVQWITADLGEPAGLAGLHDVALWHDRAALHFLTEAREREAYSATVNRAVRPGGYVVLAAFSLAGARDCSGLPIRNYDARMLGEVLGDAFREVESFDHLYINPAGDPRPYVYALFQRHSA